MYGKKITRMLRKDLDPCGCPFKAYASTVVVLLTIVSVATAKYSGGTGDPNDPYQIATAADLIRLGETPADYGKHFILTADIDLDPKLPGGKVFDRAPISPDADSAKSGFQGTSFTGVFDGTGHTISHLTIKGKDFLGLFGYGADEVKGLARISHSPPALGSFGV